MARIFITGSADGLGQLSAKLLIEEGHKVVLHARNTERATAALKNNPGAESVLTADLSGIEETKKLAAKVNELGLFDAVIHNAGVYQASPKQIFNVNTVAPYILTSLINKPKRLIYLSSGLHQSGQPHFEHFKNNVERINYSDSKLHVLMLAFAVANRWPDVFSNGVNPGWVPTKMGGRNASDDLQKGYETQSWLAVSEDEKAKVTGRYFFHQKEQHPNPLAQNTELQNKLLSTLQDITGVSFP